MSRVTSLIVFRLLSIFVSLSLAYSASAMGLNPAILALLRKIHEMQQAQQNQVAQTVPMFTDQPTEIYYGDNPDRDPDHRGGMWTDEDLYELGKQIQENQLEWGTVEANKKGRHLISLVGSGAGDAMPWERTFGAVDTSTGNRKDDYPIVSWPIRGGGTLDFSLSHSSKSNLTTLAGCAWYMSYDCSVAQTYNDLDQLTGANVYDDEGGIVHFTYHSSTPHYTPPGGIYDALVQNTGGTWTLTKKDQTKWNFDSNGYSSSWVDRAGNTVTIGRNTSHQITTLTDPTSRTLTLTYNSAGTIATVTDPTSRTWTITHTSAGDISDLAYPSLSGTIYHQTFGYSSHAITSETDLRGKTWTRAYDGNNSCTSETDPLSHATSYSYTTGACTMTLPGGQTVTDNYSSGLIASRVDGASYSTAYGSYDTNKNPQTVTDRRGKVWMYTYDSSGSVLTKTDPLAHIWTFTYDSANDLLTSKDPLNNTTTMTYNSAGKVLTVTDPLSRAVETNTYDSHGLRLTSKNAMNEETDFGYGANGDCTSITDPLSKMTTITVDSLGRETAVTDPLSHTSSTSYDAWGRPTTITNSDSTSQATAYDREDNIVSVTDENSHSTSNVYDDAGRLISTTNARGDVETYGYNSNDWRTSVQNGRGYTRYYTFTSRGEVYTLTMPDSSVETWSYDANGNTSAYTNPLSQTINYAFDNASRQTTIDYATGTDTTFTYDNANRRTSMVDSTGTTSWTYNNGSEVTALSTPQGSITYTYENSGRRHTMVETGIGTTTYLYDSDGNLVSLGNPFSETTTFIYDDASRLTRKTFASGAYTAFGYDSRNRTISISHKRSDATTLSAESYSYDNVGNLTSKTVDGTTSTYTYDNIDQLLSESHTGYSASYSYDGNGNRAAKTLNGTTETYTTDNSDRLTGITAGGVAIKSYGYDTAGRTTSVTTSVGTTCLSYDYEGRLTAIVYPDSSTNSFAYNGFDTRVSKVESSGTTSYKHDGADVTDPLVNDGIANYTPGISERRSGATRFIHSDRLTSTTVISDATQSVTDTRQCDAYGLLVASSGSTPTPYAFAGGYGYLSDSASGLMLLGHRYYDASTGRFLTRDPAKDGRNWYSYCENNPENQVDSTGLGPNALYVLLLKVKQPAHLKGANLEALAALAIGISVAVVGVGTTGAGGVGAVGKEISTAALTDRFVGPSDGDIKAPPKKRGRPPIGTDGFPMEIHHEGRKSAGILRAITRTEHRLGGNQKKNHPNLGKEASEIDRGVFAKERKLIWQLWYDEYYQHGKFMQ